MVLVLELLVQERGQGWQMKGLEQGHSPQGLGQGHSPLGLERVHRHLGLAQGHCQRQPELALVLQYLGKVPAQVQAQTWQGQGLGQWSCYQ